ncbi:hypothetical protein OGATHE_001173 [Ogataea polymorpha]|uniref:Uncharacterized protein n=1 Tax=Ogataea polymorpha TaxID=460523 RepID=A0A9P8TFB1_9ASCO|nr:hypothetical protein OGATHE_001173 [Ogataea polymorpha]
MMCTNFLFTRSSDVSVIELASSFRYTLGIKSSQILLPTPTTVFVSLEAGTFSDAKCRLSVIDSELWKEPVEEDDLPRCNDTGTWASSSRSSSSSPSKSSSSSFSSSSSSELVCWLCGYISGDVSKGFGTWAFVSLAFLLADFIVFAASSSPRRKI